jgi:hypothetical protein
MPHAAGSDKRGGKAILDVSSVTVKEFSGISNLSPLVAGHCWTLNRLRD